MSEVKAIQLSWIVVTDLKASIKFYQDVVGLKLTQNSEEFGWAEMSGMDGGALLGIAQSNDEEEVKPGQNAVVTFTVENLDTAKADMAKKGVTFIGNIIEVPGHVRMQTFKDKDDNRFQIVEMLS
ncbi:MAG: VOC family protein [Parachlamydiaceae bacterium]|nr:VOC family protein [Parachlamydiaceae bacterium]